MRNALLALAVPGALVAAWASSSCAPSGFADPALVSSVRILASSASEPYARPGDTVTVQVLAYDGRATQAEPMKIFWLPLPCVNPANDAYYACFAQLGSGVRGDGGADAGAGDAGAGGLLAALKPGVDLTSLLAQGTSTSVTIPADVVSSHAPSAGVAPYGLVILFNFACAGHIELVPATPGNENPQQIPFGCFDDQHDQLGPDDFVFGFTRIYASETVSDSNPVVIGVDAPGGPLAIDGGQTPALPVASCGEATASNCPHVAIGPIVEPPAAGREVWADFYSTAGSFTSDARLLYGSGAAPDGGVTSFLAPADAGGGFVWIVVHDDLNGASWVTVPIAVR